MLASIEEIQEESIELMTLAALNVIR